MIEAELLENKERREEMIDRIDILDKVGTLLLLPNTQLTRIEQVADYYKVTQRHIELLLSENREELESDGIRIYKAEDFISELDFGNKVIKQRGKFLVQFSDDNIISFAPRGVLLFTKRSILRIGMLLKESLIAQDVRNRLLDIIHDVEKQQPQIINNIVNDIRTEQNIMQDMMQAMYEGDYAKESQLKTELLGFKTKRIKELEKINKTITTNATTIQDTRLVINRIVRCIAERRYYGNFKACWDRVWCMANYKLNMNVKKRVKKKYEYLIDTLTEDELRQLELMVRNWGNELGYDIEEILKI
jgi:RNA polymerase-binding transcription factor DksA